MLFSISYRTGEPVDSAIYKTQFMSMNSSAITFACNTRMPMIYQMLLSSINDDIVAGVISAEASARDVRVHCIVQNTCPIAFHVFLELTWTIATSDIPLESLSFPKGARSGRTALKESFDFMNAVFARPDMRPDGTRLSFRDLAYLSLLCSSSGLHAYIDAWRRLKDCLFSMSFSTKVAPLLYKVRANLGYAKPERFRKQHNLPATELGVWRSVYSVLPRPDDLASCLVDPHFAELEEIFVISGSIPPPELVRVVPQSAFESIVAAFDEEKSAIDANIPLAERNSTNLKIWKSFGLHQKHHNLTVEKEKRVLQARTKITRKQKRSEKTKKNLSILDTDEIFEAQGLYDAFKTISNSASNVAIPMSVSLSEEAKVHVEKVIASINGFTQAIRSFKFPSLSDLNSMIDKLINKTLDMPFAKFVLACLVSWQAYKSKSSLLGITAVLLHKSALSKVFESDGEYAVMFQRIFKTSTVTDEVITKAAQQDAEAPTVNIVKAEEIVADPQSSWLDALEPIMDLKKSMAFLTLGNLIQAAPDLRVSIKDVNNFMGFFAKFPAAITGFSTFVEYLKTMMSNMMNWFRVNVLNKQMKVFFPIGVQALDTWADSCLGIASKFVRKELEPSLALRSEVGSLLSKGFEFKSAYSTRGSSQIAQRHITSCMTSLAPIVNMLDNANLNIESVRYEPLCILLVGDSGVGKTKLQIPFVQYLATQVLTEEELKTYSSNPSSFVYTRNHEQNFWDGYKSQPITIFDDFLQAKDAPGASDSEAMSFIRLGSSFPFALHMASLEQKSNTYFNSRIVIASTNHKKVSTNAIHFQEAISNRFSVKVRVEIKPEFRVSEDQFGNSSGKLDLKKYKAKFGNKGFEKSIYLFQPIEWSESGSEENGAPMDYDTFMQHCISIYSDKANKSENYAAEVRDLTRQAIEKRLSAIAEDDSKDALQPQADAGVVVESADAGIQVEMEPVEESIDEVMCVDKAEKIPEMIKEVNLWSEYWVECFALASRCKLTNDEILRRLEKVVACCNLNNTAKIFCMESEQSLNFLRIYFSKNVSNTWSHPIVEPVLDILKRCRVAFYDIPFVLAAVWGKVFSYNTVELCPEVFKFTASTIKDMSRMTYFKEYVQHFNTKIHLAVDACAKHTGKRIMEGLKRMHKTMFIDHPFVTAAGFGLSLLAGVGVFYATQKFIFGEEEKPTTQLDGRTHDFEESHRDVKMKRVKAMRSAQGWRDRVSPQGVDVADLYEEVAVGPISSRHSHVEDVGKKLMSESVFQIIYNGKKVLGHLIFVSGNVAIMPLHFQSLIQAWIDGDLKRPTSLSIASRGVRPAAYEVKLEDIGNYYTDESMKKGDLCLVKLSGIPRKRNIVNKFVTEKWLEKNNKNFEATLYVPGLVGVHAEAVKATFYDHQDIRELDASDCYRIHNVVRYGARCSQGDCGSPLLLHTTSEKFGRIVGIHVAGMESASLGVTFVVTREMLRDAVEIMDTETIVEPQICMPTDFDDCESIEVIGSISGAPYRCTETSLRASKLRGVLQEINNAPAILKSYTSDGKRVDPITRAIKVYDKPLVELDDDLLKRSARDFTFHMDSRGMKEKSSDARLLTFEEAVIGVEDERCLRALPRSTSAGWPYVSTKRRQNKYDVFGDGELPVFTSLLCRELKEKVVQHVVSAEKGEKLFLPFCGYLKDERRSLKKIAAKESRYISAANLESYILFKMYFGMFMSKIQESNLLLGVGVGVNVYSRDWDHIAREINCFGDVSVADGDFKAFDASSHPRITNIILDYVNEWYNDGNGRVRRALWETIDYSQHIVDGMLLQWKGKMPSGHLLTAVNNCLTNLIIWRYAWYSQKNLSSYFSKPFSYYVTLWVMGDDNILSVHPEVAKEFSPTVFAETFPRLGYTYTSSDKTMEGLRFKRLEECSFLKRGFRLDPDYCQYFGPLELKAILDIACWYKKGDSEVEAVRVNAETALRELCFHEMMICKAESKRIVTAFARVYGESLFRPFREDVLLGYPGLFEQAVTAIEPQMTDLSSMESGPQLSLGIYPYSSGETQNYQATVNVPVCMTPQAGFDLGVTESTTVKSAHSATTMEVASANSTSGAIDTGFIDSGETAETSYTLPVSAYKSGLQPSLSDVSKDIRDFLATPVEISQSIVGAASTAKTLLTVVNLTTGLSLEHVSAKIRGYRGLNFKTRLRVNVSVDPFYQGRLLVIYVPGNPLDGGGIIGQGRDSTTPNMSLRLASLGFMTQFPSMEMDISNCSVGEMEVPFIHIAPYWFNPTGGASSYELQELGSFLVYVYGSVATGAGGTGGTLTTYLSYHDVELALPGPQGRAGVKTMNQLRGTGRTDPELNRDDIRPISGAMKGLSFASSALAKIPLLSSVMSPAAWVLENMSNSAKSFGFSNPEIESLPHLVTRIGLQNLANSDVPVCHQGLSLTRHNRIMSTPLLKGSDEDELAIASIVSRSAWISTYNWSVNDPVLTKIALIPVTVLSKALPVQTAGQSFAVNSPMSFVASFFAYWRGSITYRLKFVKTKFHAGRLDVSFYPSGVVASAPTIPSTVNPYLMREIVDISELTQLDVTVPFFSTTPYVTTGTITGYLQLTVLNKLSAGDQVAQSIDILVEVLGGSDLEFAGPINTTSGTNNLVYTQFVPQMALPEAGDEKKEIKMGGDGPERMSLVPAEMCMGEQVRSLRSLLKRPGKIMKTSTALPLSGFYGDPGTVLSGMITSSVVSGATVYNREECYSDMYSSIVSCFYMRRGGMQFKALVRSSDGLVTTATVTAGSSSTSDSTSFSNQIALGANRRLCSPWIADHSDNARTLSVAVPFYSPTPWVLVSYTTPTAPSVGNGPGRRPLKLCVAVDNFTTSGATAPMDIYRSIADDFDVGVWLSTPPVLDVATYS